MGKSTAHTSFFRQLSVRAKSIFFPYKINVGDSNAWKRDNNLLRWTTVNFYYDSDVNYDLREFNELPLPSNSASVVFSSHTFEHIFPDNVDFVLRELFRVIKPGGVLRLSVPDYQRAVTAYEDKDDAFFRGGGVACHGDNLEELFANFFASFKCKNYGAKTDYIGGPKLTIEQREFLQNNIGKMDADSLIKYCVSLIPEEAYYVAHVNGFNFESMKSILEKSGFVDVVKSDYKASRIPELRGDAFDNRPEVSLYTECRKL